jgi:hypothetical protein
LAQDYSKIKIGACKVTFDVGATTPLVIETTIGGVEFNLKMATQEVKTDQTGDTIVKLIKKAVDVSAVVPIGEYDLKTIAKVIPGSTLITNATTSKSKVEVDGNAGLDLLDYAKELTIEPLNDAIDFTITLSKALPQPDFKFKYDANSERVTGVEFKAFPDPAMNNLMVTFGDKTVTAA